MTDLERAMKSTLLELARDAFRQARDELGSLEFTQAPDPYYRHDLKSAAERLQRSPAFVEKLNLRWFTDEHDYKQKRWVLEKDLRHYLDTRVAIATTQRDLSPQNIDPEIASELGLSTPSKDLGTRPK